MISTNEFKTGVTISFEGNIYEVLEFQHVKPGKGGAFVQTKLKNLRTGANISYTFNAGIKIDTAEIKKVEMQYLYDMDDNAVFMDNETYDQIEIPKSTIKDELQYLIVGKSAQVRFYENEVLGVVLPDKVVLEVTDTPPGERGNSATNTMKSAILETGIEIRVPMFINNGDKIVVNTVTGKYDTRYKE
ncbi:elongation factor P [bacterium]|nr:elongation factor P [bacterium]